MSVGLIIGSILIVVSGVVLLAIVLWDAGEKPGVVLWSERIEAAELQRRVRGTARRPSAARRSGHGVAGAALRESSRCTGTNAPRIDLDAPERAHLESELSI